MNNGKSPLPHKIVLFLQSAVLACMLFFLSCEETTGPEEETPLTTRKLLIYSESLSIPANGGSTRIVVKVYSDNDTTKVVSGVKVSFSANLSGINLVIPAQNEITDAGGYARATLYAGTRVGTAAVTASIENFSNTIFISVTPGKGLVTAEPTSILADGLSQSTITATVIDSLGQPLPGARVQFEASSGTITPQSFSDEQGRATAVLRSTPSASDISCTVTARTETGKIAKVAIGDSAEENGPAASKPAKAAGLIGTTTVVFRGITITGTPGKTTVFANGADSTLINVSVKETTTGEAVAGAELAFSATLGGLRSSSGVTDESGNAGVVLFGGNVSGEAVFSAVLSEGLAYTTRISLIKQLFMTIESSPSVLSANGTDVSTIKASLFDADNNPVKDETIYFSTTLGKILPSAVTDEWGEAKVSLRSSRFNGVAVVTAKYRSIEKTTSVKFTGSDIRLAASPLVLVADGESRSKLTATLIDASGYPIVGETVVVTTSRGTLHSADMRSSGSTVVDSTSTEGKLTAYLSSDEAGTAVVVFKATGLEDSLEVDFTEYTFSLMAEKPEILAGGHEVVLTAVLRDKDGNITKIASGDVTFSPTLGTISGKTENDDGSVSATLVSGNTAGVSTVTAHIKDPGVSASTSVTFVAAGVGSIKLETLRNFVRIGGNTVEIVARVFDESGNPKSGETVTFSIVKGPGGGEKLDTGTAMTNDVGMATVSFISGMTGSGQNGVEIQGRVGSVTDTVRLTITGQPETVVVGFDTKNYITNADGTLGVMVSAIVSDVNRNKVADGTIVNFSLIGDIGVIDPEVKTVNGVASTVLIYSASDAGKDVKVTASSGGKQDTKELTLPGATGTVAKLTASPNEYVILADGVSKANFAVSLSGIEGEPINNYTIICSADIGKINPTALTGDPSDPESVPGVANVSYTSPALHEDRVATVTFTAGGISKTVRIQLKGITLTATADPTLLPSDGQSKSRIQVLVKETSTHIPIVNQPVYFGSTDGIIGATSLTDANGVATTTFTAGYDAGVTDIYVSYGKTLVDTLRINISEVTARGIELFANPTQIAANGISRSTITALLRDDNFNPVVGEVIRFTTTLGTITAVDSTDEFGRAEAILESERRNGQAIVTATFKEHVKTIPVNFTGVKLSVSATPENLFAGGDEKTEVTAYLKDAADVPIVGEEVKFEWYMGDEKKSELKAVTDVQGRASIKLSSNDSGLSKIIVKGAGAVDSTFVTFTRIRFTINGEVDEISTGGDTLRVWVQLFDTVNDKYIEGTEVNFYTTMGEITSSAVSDAEGKAFADLVSGPIAGSVTVSASAVIDGNRVSSDAGFKFVNAPVGSIDFRVDANIVGIGGNTSALIAVVKDKYGNPVSDALVSFKIIQGPAGGEYIRPPTVTTGPSGTATTYFYSGQIPSEFEGVHLQAYVGDISSNISKLTIAGAPALIRPSFNTDWSLDNINNGNGTYTLPVSATVLDINSNGVVDGTTVYFKIEPAEGAVLSPVKTKNSVAVSSITYPSAAAGREVKLTASAGGIEGSIDFSLPGFVVSYISLSASPKTILADGKSTSEIKATLFDKSGSSANVPDGTTVSFTTEGGTLDPEVVKTVNGVAVTTLTSDKSADRLVLVEAKSGLISDATYVYFESIGSSVNQVSDIEVKAFDLEGNENPTIEADGISSARVVAYLRKYDGYPVTVPTTVAFESDIGRITSFVRSDTTGMAVASFSSGDVGTATIKASVGNVIGYASVVVNPGPPRSAELSFSPKYVNVKGAGKNETLVVTASVKDSKGNPVSDGNFVRFTLVGSYDPDSSISPAGDTQWESSPVPTLNGVATVSFHAGTKAGAVRIKAVVVDENGDPMEPPVTSETTQFMVYGGPAYMDLSTPGDPYTNSRIKLYSGPRNIYAGAIGTDYNKATITAAIADRYNNPVPPGTAIYFTTTGGYITNATGYTDENGMATVTLYSGNPFPTLDNSSKIPNPNYDPNDPGSPEEFEIPKWDFDDDGVYNDGIATVIASTEGIDQNGDEATVWNFCQVIFSGPVHTFTVTSDADTLNIGQVAVIYITIKDINGNPIVGDSAITITASEGKLSTKSITTGDPGQIIYTTTLTNDLDPLTDTPGYAVVSVKLVSPNGNHTVELDKPIYLTTSSQ